MVKQKQEPAICKCKLQSYWMRVISPPFNAKVGLIYSFINCYVYLWNEYPRRLIWLAGRLTKSIRGAQSHLPIFCCAFKVGLNPYLGLWCMPISGILLYCIFTDFLLYFVFFIFQLMGAYFSINIFQFE